jgi:UDP-glucose 4-epimerase
MRILVVGGAGYVGSHCVRRLLAADHRVTVFDNLSAGHRAAVDPRATFVLGDLADRAALDRALTAERYDAAMHFAAFINVGDSVNEPLKYWRNNVANTLNLLDAMQAHGVRRFVFSSTCAVHGEPEDLPMVETLPRNPVNPYGHTKLAVEWLLESSATAWGLGAVMLRYFNASGAAPGGVIGEDHRPETHLIPIVLQVALGQREHLKVYGADYPTPDGTCVRDYIHVDDLAEAHLLAVRGGTPGKAEAFNVGTGRGHSVLEIVSAARAVTGHPIPVVIAERRAGDAPALYANSDKLRGTYGWQPRHLDIRELIASAWEWHRTHPHGFAD